MASGRRAVAAVLPIAVALQDGAVLSRTSSGVVPTGKCKFPMLGLSSFSWRAVRKRIFLASPLLIILFPALSSVRPLHHLFLVGNACVLSRH